MTFFWNALFCIRKMSGSWSVSPDWASVVSLVCRSSHGVSTMSSVKSGWSAW